MKYKIKKRIFNYIFPRGSQYPDHENIFSDYEASYTDVRKISIFYKYNRLNSSPKGVVILAHPYLKEASLFFQQNGHTGLYESLGFHVVLFDFNGFGRSSFVDFKHDADIREVLDWAIKHFDTNQIILHGISFGAAQIIRFLHNNSGYNTMAIIENCLDKSLHYFKVRNIKTYYFLKAIQSIKPSVREDGDFTRLINNIKSIEKVAFIYCTEDTLTSVDMGMKLRAQCNIPSEMLLCSGQHLKAIKDQQKYLSFINNFTGN
jgi:hypothetical protein